MLVLLTVLKDIFLVAHKLLPVSLRVLRQLHIQTLKQVLMVFHVVSVDCVDIVIAEQNLGETLVALVLKVVFDVVHVADGEVELLLLKVQLDLYLLEVLDDPLI